MEGGTIFSGGESTIFSFSYGISFQMDESSFFTPYAGLSLGSGTKKGELISSGGWALLNTI
jgi:long-subunit fatty acid transport protein